MAEVASAYVSLLPSARGFGKSLDKQVSGDVEASGKRAGSGWGKMFALGAAAAVGGGALKFLGDAISEASEAQQSLGATESIFKQFSETVITSSKGAAQEFGLSANQYRESANLIGSLFKNQGVSMDQLAGKTDTMIGRASDLAAMFGGTTAEAVEALGSAFKGEFNPLEKYGITLNQSAINAELAAKGQDKLSGSALTAAKNAATMDLIMRQSKDSMGTFAAESNTLAGQQQRLSAQWTDMKATIGTQLLPILTQFAGFVNSTVLPALGSIGRFVKDNQTTLIALAAAFAVATLAVQAHSLALSIAAAGGLVKYLASMKIVTAATKVWTAVQWLLNAALRANPIGIVITVLAALGAALVVAWKNSSKFRDIVTAGFKAVANSVKSSVKAIGDAVKAVFNAIRSAAQAFVGWLGANWKVITVILSGPFAPAVALILANLDRIIAGGRKVLDWFRGLPGDIKGAFSGAGTMLLSVGQDIIGGLMSGIRSMAGSLVATIKSYVIDKIPGPVKKALGISSPSRVFKEIGEDVMAGLAIGIAGDRKVDDSIAALVQKVKTGGKKAAKNALAGIKEELAGSRELLKSARDLGTQIAEAISGALTPGDLFGGITDEDGSALDKFRGAMGKWGADVASASASVASLIAQGIGGDFLKNLVSSGNTGLMAQLASSGEAAVLQQQYNANVASAAEIGRVVGAQIAGPDIARLENAVSHLGDRLEDALDRYSDRFGKTINGAAARGQRTKKSRPRKGRR